MRASAVTRWITKNGKRIPLTGSGGGKGAGTVVAAGVLAWDCQPGSAAAV